MDFVQPQYGVNINGGSWGGASSLKKFGRSSVPGLSLRRHVQVWQGPWMPEWSGFVSLAQIGLTKGDRKGETYFMSIRFGQVSPVEKPGPMITLRRFVGHLEIEMGPKNRCEVWTLVTWTLRHTYHCCANAPHVDGERAPAQNLTSLLACKVEPKSLQHLKQDTWKRLLQAYVH